MHGRDSNGFGCVATAGSAPQHQAARPVSRRTGGCSADEVAQPISTFCACLSVCIHADNGGPWNFTMSCSSQQRSSDQQWSSNIQHNVTSTYSATACMSHSGGPILRKHATNRPLTSRCGATCNKSQTHLGITPKPQKDHLIDLSCVFLGLHRHGPHRHPARTQSDKTAVRTARASCHERRAAEASLPRCPPWP